MIEPAFLFVVGLTLIILGADWLVRGASVLAQRLGVSTLVVGLTVVAFGTSAPELVVSAIASLNGQPDIAVGNVMGSTVANVGLIVGLGALIRPISAHRRLIVRETPLVVCVLTIVMVLSLNDALGRLDGFALLLGWALYLLFLFRWGSREFQEAVEPSSSSGDARSAVSASVATGGAGQAAAAESSASDSQGPADDQDSTAGPSPPPEAEHGLWWSLLRIGIGLPCLTYGAGWLLAGAEPIAIALELPDAVIAATLIAVGTSLPELASTLAASFRGMGDIAIGSVIGSNVFNLGLVLGTAAMLRPLHLPPALVVQYVLPALAFSIILIPLALTNGRVDRWEGGLLLSLYIGYVTWIIL